MAMMIRPREGRGEQGQDQGCPSLLGLRGLSALPDPPLAPPCLCTVSGVGSTRVFSALFLQSPGLLLSSLLFQWLCCFTFPFLSDLLLLAPLWRVALSSPWPSSQHLPPAQNSVPSSVTLLPCLDDSPKTPVCLPAPVPGLRRQWGTRRVRLRWFEEWS